MRKRILLAASLGLFMLCAAFTYRGQATKPQWEYMSTDNTTTKKLNQLGAEGWELVGVEPHVSGGTTITSTAYFKRAKQ